MPIGTGQVSASAINLELGRGSTAAISINTAEDGGYGAINGCSPSRPSSGNPAAMSEWRGYNHQFACCNAPSISSNSVTSDSFTINVSFSNCTTMHIESSSNGGNTWLTVAVNCASTRTVGGLASGTSFLVRVRMTCTSTGGFSGYSNQITVTTSAGCPAYGTFLSQFCSGCTLFYRYANGSCGTYDVSQGVTTQCGACCGSTPSGTFKGDFCSGCEYYYVYSDGCNGQYTVLQDSNSPNCGGRCGPVEVICLIYYTDGSGYWSGTDCFGNFVDGFAYEFGEYAFCGFQSFGGVFGDANNVCGRYEGCPTPNMPILTSPGHWTTAGELNPGDYVYTKHETTGEWGSYMVTSANPATNLVSRTVIGGEEITVSHNHRFLTESMGFVALSELWVGAKVQTSTGLAQIESIEEIGELPVIQIEVDQAHTYVIGTVISHNKKDFPK